ncbi:chymotrypsin-2-like [Anopheles merus]|uniref:Peptidase S1 domain-containing protein n=1 Tax=Anopheles merus TaxID=30066 RepID=A0A182VIM7_ANOME|nr:chymotrypsin-2-like [Anopheles merus]
MPPLGYREDHPSSNRLHKMFRLSVLLTICLAATALGNVLSPEYYEWAGRIVGGQNAGTNQFPYQVSLRSSGNSHFCGGSIINNRYVLSAAHCTVGRTTANTISVVGAIFLNGGGIAHSTARIVNHPNYNANTLANDVSLVQTATFITYTAAVQPIALGTNFVTGGGAVASGWGQLGANVGIPNHLQFLNTQIITLADCRNRHTTANAGRVFDSTVCTLSPSGQGMCMGDSGGPLVQGGALHGIVSWGIPCGLGMPDVFARVSSFVGWINANAV